METPRPIAAMFLDQNDQRVERLATRYRNATIAEILTDESGGEVTWTEEDVAGYRKGNAKARKSMLVKQRHLDQLMADGDPQPAT